MAALAQDFIFDEAEVARGWAMAGGLGAGKRIVVRWIGGAARVGPWSRTVRRGGAERGSVVRVRGRVCAAVKKTSFGQKHPPTLNFYRSTLSSTSLDPTGGSNVRGTADPI
jgi:hypothetical protein